jgi:hypothetical protein
MKVRAAIASGYGVDGVRWLWDREPSQCVGSHSLARERPLPIGDPPRGAPEKTTKRPPAGRGILFDTGRNSSQARPTAVAHFLVKTGTARGTGRFCRSE